MFIVSTPFICFVLHGLVLLLGERRQRCRLFLLLFPSSGHNRGIARHKRIWYYYTARLKDPKFLQLSYLIMYLLLILQGSGRQGTAVLFPALIGQGTNRALQGTTTYSIIIVDSGSVLFFSY